MLTHLDILQFHFVVEHFSLFNLLTHVFLDLELFFTELFLNFHYASLRHQLYLSVILLCVIILYARRKKALAFRKMTAALQESQNRLRFALKGIDADVWEWSAASNLLYLENNRGVLKSERTSFQVFPEDISLYKLDKALILKQWNRLTAGDIEVLEFNYRFRAENDSWRWLKIRGRIVERCHHTQQVLRIAGVYYDMTAQYALEREHHLYSKAFSYTAEGVMLLNADLEIKMVNAAACKIFMMQRSHIIGKLFCEVLVDLRFKHCESDLQNKKSWSGDVNLKLANGASCPVWLNISLIDDKQSLEEGYVVVFSDMRERKNYEKKLWQLANYDELTKLPNRSYSQKLLQDAIHAADQTNKSCALVFLDFNRFKQINDSYGHEAGDKILTSSSARIVHCCSEHEQLCRFGGDEFVIIVSHETAKYVEDLCRKIVKAFIQPLYIDDEVFYQGISMGVSLYPQDARDTKTLIKHADLAMYQAKWQSESNFQFYSRHARSLHAEVLTKVRLEHDLRKAIEQEQFELYFQPQMDVIDRQMFGVEALLRWNHPEEGSIAPNIFIQTAETVGLISYLDEWVLRKACEQGTAWYAQGYVFKLSVNISASWFLKPNFVELVSDILLQANFPPEYLTLEITETVLMERLSLAQVHLESLQKLGVSIAIDDFGTGYSSLAYLHQLSVNTLKIDRSFIENIGTDLGVQAMTSSMIGLAKNLSLNVIAEGVENKTQLDEVCQRGCFLIQGFYFSKPLSVIEMSCYLKQRCPRLECVS